MSNFTECFTILHNIPGEGVIGEVESVVTSEQYPGGESQEEGAGEPQYPGQYCVLDVPVHHVGSLGEGGWSISIIDI